MKNKGFIKVMLLSASLITCCSNAVAQAGATIAEVENNGFKAILYNNTNRSNGKTNIALSIQSIEEGVSFVNERRSGRRIRVLRQGNGVRMLTVWASLNANLAKATLGNVFESAIASKIENMTFSISARMRLPNGEVEKRSAKFDFEGLPLLSNFNSISSLRAGCSNNTIYEKPNVTISDANVIYNAEKRRIEVTARVGNSGGLKYTDWYIRNLETACERSTPMGTTRDCKEYVKNVLAQSNAGCSMFLGFGLVENGVIRTADLTPNGSSGTFIPQSSRVVVPLMSSPVDSPPCADGPARLTRFYINVAGLNDSDGIKIAHYFPDAKASYTLIPASRIPGPNYMKRNRFACTDGSEVELSLPIPAELQAQ